MIPAVITTSATTWPAVPRGVLVNFSSSRKRASTMETRVAHGDDRQNRRAERYGANDPLTFPWFALHAAGAPQHGSQFRGNVMGKEARIALLLAASACLLAVMVDWVVAELHESSTESSRSR